MSRQAIVNCMGLTPLLLYNIATGRKIPQTAEWVLERLPAMTDPTRSQRKLLDDWSD